MLETCRQSSSSVKKKSEITFSPLKSVMSRVPKPGSRSRALRELPLNGNNIIVEILTRTDKPKPEMLPLRMTCTNKLKPSPKPAPVTYTDKRKPTQLPLPTQMTDDKRKPIQLPLPAQMTDSNGKTSNGILHSNRFNTKLYKLTHELQRTMLNRLV